MLRGFKVSLAVMGVGAIVGGASFFTHRHELLLCGIGAALVLGGILMFMSDGAFKLGD